MPGTNPATPVPASTEMRIAQLLARFAPTDRKIMQDARKALRKRFPTLNELIYDYARNFVIGYSPTQAGGQGIVALSADHDGVRFYLTQGSKLPDPQKLLMGKAGARYMLLTSAKDLLRPEVEALMGAAEKASKIPIPKTGRGQLIMKPSTAGKKTAKKATKR